jgi:2-polyprenyl-3-methyl-5-hydroxy-6-metoxy-1,4-benzoquinol methylase
MRNNPFEAGVDVDVEALMSRLRESTKHAGPDVDGALSPHQLNSKALKRLQPQQLHQEIEAGALHADAFNRIPLKTRGSKIRIERPIKRFLKWLVHWNTSGQVEFNQSVIRSFGLIAKDIERGQENFALLDDFRRDIGDLIRQTIQNETGAVESRLRENLNRNLRETGKLKTQVSNYLAVLEAGRMNLTKEAIQRDIQNEIGVVAARLREDLDRNTADTGKLRAQVSNYMAILEAGRVNLTRLERTLSEAIAEMNRYMPLVLEETRNHSSELKVELNYQLDELRMRTLRLERIARTTSGPEHPAAEVSREHVADGQVDLCNQRTNGNEKPSGSPDTSTIEPVTGAFDYFLFEHQERGPVSEIKRRQLIYLDLFRGRSNVVDLGCGRGEFVELLVENGINVTGVDIGEDMADFCRDRGLPVVQADIFEYLSSMPDETFDGIFLSQVVEHFSPEQILRLVSMCAKKLQPGGVIVAETVNTNCPTALSNFYLDPTHVRPVPPELLKFMIEQQGFEFQTFRFSTAVSGNDAGESLDIDSGFTKEGRLYQDYAVIALRLQRSPLESTGDR